MCSSLRSLIILVNSPMAIYKNEIYNLPFNMNTFSKLWGIKTPAEAKAKIEEQIAELAVDEPQNLEEQALKLAGRDVYEKLVKGYTEKQWGRECRELPAFIIKRLPLRFTYDNNYFADRYQGIPMGGYTAMIEKMLDGTEVRLNTEYRSFVKEQETALANGADAITYNKVLYTGMMMSISAIPLAIWNIVPCILSRRTCRNVTTIRAML